MEFSGISQIYLHEQSKYICVFCFGQPENIPLYRDKGKNQTAKPHAPQGFQHEQKQNDSPRQVGTGIALL
jgi:hypothetical protein